MPVSLWPALESRRATCRRYWSIQERPCRHGSSLSRDLKPLLNRSAQDQTIEIPVGGQENRRYLDWLSGAQADVAAAAEGDPAARPTIAPSANSAPLQSDHGVLTIPLKAYGAAILTEQKS